MKTFKTLFAFLLLSSFLFISCEEDSSVDDIIESESITPGLYKKQVSQTTAYLKITSTQAFLCRAQDNIEFSGSLIGNTVHFEVDGSIIQTELRHEGNNLWARNLINNVYDEWTLYFSSNDSYPCSDGGNGSNFELNGRWIRSDGTGINIINNSYAPFTSYSPNWQIIYDNGLINSSTRKLKSITVTSNSLRWDCEVLWWSDYNDIYSVAYSDIGQILMNGDGSSITISSIVNLADFGNGQSGTHSQSYTYYRD